jgi:GT2 family glycosyltransferase
MMKRRNLSVAVIICTQSHRVSLFTCLDSVRNQDRPPEHVIVIEKAPIRPALNYAQLRSYLGTRIRKVSYYRVRKEFVAYSRNLGIRKTVEDIIFFVDDDVVLEKSYISKLMHVYSAYPQINSVVGRVNSPSGNYWQTFSNLLITAAVKNPNLPQIVDHWPTLNFSVKRTCLLKSKLRFDERFSGMSDMDFCFRFKSAGYRINYIPTLSVFHLHRTSLIGFVQSFRGYFRRNVYLLDTKYPDIHLFDINVFRVHSRNRIVYFLKVLKRIIVATFSFVHNLSFPKKYIFACLVYQIVLYLAIKDDYRFGASDSLQPE